MIPEHPLPPVERSSKLRSRLKKHPRREKRQVETKDDTATDNIQPSKPIQESHGPHKEESGVNCENLAILCICMLAALVIFSYLPDWLSLMTCMLALLCLHKFKVILPELKTQEKCQTVPTTKSKSPGLKRDDNEISTKYIQGPQIETNRNDSPTGTEPSSTCHNDVDGVVSHSPEKQVEEKVDAFAMKSFNAISCGGTCNPDKQTMIDRKQETVNTTLEFIKTLLCITFASRLSRKQWANVLHGLLALSRKTCSTDNMRMAFDGVVGVYPRRLWFPFGRLVKFGIKIVTLSKIKLKFRGVESAISVLDFGNIVYQTLNSLLPLHYTMDLMCPCGNETCLFKLVRRGCCEERFPTGFNSECCVTRQQWEWKQTDKFEWYASDLWTMMYRPVRHTNQRELVLYILHDDAATNDAKKLFSMLQEIIGDKKKVVLKRREERELIDFLMEIDLIINFASPLSDKNEMLQMEISNIYKLIRNNHLPPIRSYFVRSGEVNTKWHLCERHIFWGEDDTKTLLSNRIEDLIRQIDNSGSISLGRPGDTSEGSEGSGRWPPTETGTVQ